MYYFENEGFDLVFGNSKMPLLIITCNFIIQMHCLVGKSKLPFSYHCIQFYNLGAEQRKVKIFKYQN